MVGVDPEQKTPLPRYIHGLAGAISGFTTRTLTQPIDVCKIRMQLQIEPINKGSDSSKYKSVYQTFHVIVKEEGITGLWKGTIPGQILSVVYGVVEFGAFEAFNRLAWNLRLVQNPKDPLVYFGCGSLAGMVATLASQPLDVLRTRFVSQGNYKVYSSLYNSVQTIWHGEGVRGFYRGLIPSIIQIAPSSGASFAFYAYFQRIYRTVSGQRLSAAQSDSLESIVCGSSAGAAAKTLVYPLDVVKKRLQVQGFEEGRKGFGRFIHLTNFRESWRKTYYLEGIQGFFKGYSPSLLKAAVSTGLSFFFYDQSLNVLTRIHFS